MAMTAIIGMCALVIDVGSSWQVTQQAQAAADAASTTCSSRV
jgi:Flp pilus assembly protein TadG